MAILATNLITTKAPIGYTGSAGSTGSAGTTGYVGSKGLDGAGITTGKAIAMAMVFG